MEEKTLFNVDLFSLSQTFSLLFLFPHAKSDILSLDCDQFRRTLKLKKIIFKVEERYYNFDLSFKIDASIVLNPLYCDFCDFVASAFVVTM